MTYRAWICESCKRPQRYRENVWNCPGCGKETCDDCGWMYGHCKPCCEGKEPEALRVAANLTGDFDFEAPAEAR